MKKVTGIFRNIFTVGALTALSRVLGLVREMLQSRLIGAGVEQSAFTIAFAIPNMARKLFGEGALTAAFVPIFKSEVEKEGLAKAASLARSVMTTVLLVLVAVVILCTGLVDTVVSVCSQNDGANQERFALIGSLVKTLLPYMIFICAAAFGMGVLNSLGNFKSPGFMPCLLNLCWIGMLSALFFFPEWSVEKKVKAVAVAILFAGALQAAFMFYCMAKAGVMPKLSFSGWFCENTKKVWRNIGIGAIGAGTIQINYMLDQILAQIASPWAAGVIGYAERLMDLPLGVVAVAFGTVLLPTLSGYFAKGDLSSARNTLCSSMITLMIVMLPAAIGLFALAREVTGVIYEGRAFDGIATLRVSRALAVYAIGLGFFGFQKTITPWFHAQGDLKTPLYVSLCTVLLDAVLNILAVFLLPVEWRHVGLAASTVFCSFVSCIFLILLAIRKNGATGLKNSVLPLVKILICAILMGIVIFSVKNIVHSWFSGKSCASLLALTVNILIGFMVYGIFLLAVMPKECVGFLKKSKNN
jgi:putative peptidoglycan lipid II flippase